MTTGAPARSGGPRPAVLIAGLLALVLLLPSGAGAHAEGEDYVVMSFLDQAIEGHFEVHVRDLRDKLGISVDTGADVKAQIEGSATRVHRYIEERFSIGPVAGAAYSLQFLHQDFVTLPQGLFAQYHFRIDPGPLPDRLALRHRMFFENDRWHRGLVLVEYNARTDTTYPGEYTAMVFSATNPEQTLDLTDIPAALTPRDMIPQGVWHIWIGIDHILFLVALMLPTVVRPTDDGWRPVERFPRAFWSLLKIVTVFTLAHSVTLILAALDLVVIPSRVVESVIALSIVLVAVNNIMGTVREGSVWVILGLGLFHGLGFASVMGHLPFRMVDLLRVVVGFNLGVELGQIAIVAVLFPVLYLWRTSWSYEPLALKGVSGVLVLISGWWFVQRAFELG